MSFDLFGCSASAPVELSGHNRKCKGSGLACLTEHDLRSHEKGDYFLAVGMVLAHVLGTAVAMPQLQERALVAHQH